ncbi:hypothetical protein [Pseudodesulfovibrio indicus]|uniref:hypothetical protein n=1 Tax=Pseudodesulfovibrio indicus TaxID=1716143 RepID=UPI0029313632|nr:hypothetical protein [Pseudodesulfovibrio indicus]
MKKVPFLLVAILFLSVLQGCGAIVRQKRISEISNLRPGMDYDHVVDIMQTTNVGYEVMEDGHKIRLLPTDINNQGSTWIGLCFDDNKLVSWKDDFYVPGLIFGAKVSNPGAACRGHVAGVKQNTVPIPANIVSAEAAASPAKTKAPVWYSPDGKPEIIFTHKPSDNYTINFVYSPGSYNNVSNWGKYSMMRGYFVSETPIEKSLQNYYEIKLQSGETIYYKTDTDEGLDQHFWIAHIMWYKDYLKKENSKGDPIVEGSSVTLTSYDKTYDRYMTSTGKEIYATHLDNIRNFVSTLSKNKAQIAEMLIDYQIKYKEFDNKYFISNHDGYKTSVSAYIGRIDKEVCGRFELTYHASDWLFAYKYGVVADGYRYESPRLKFDHDNSDVIWEISDEPLTDALYALGTKISTSNKAIVRFYGKGGTSDFTVPQAQKKELQDILELYKLIKSSV